jgi:hypothetical protein
MSFSIATAGNSPADTEAALGDALSTLVDSLGGTPDLLLVAASADHDRPSMAATLEATDVPWVHGFTSCMGCMTDQGMYGGGGVGMGLWAIRDPHGSYGTALLPMDADPRETGRRAIQEALEASGRSGELPALILLNPTPGFEELVLEGIQDIVGRGVPILGGSAADNDVVGGWGLFTKGLMTSAGVVLTVLFPSVDVAFSFRSGYMPTGERGVITESSGRTLKSIDGEPAARVYNRWTGGVLDSVLGDGGNALPLTSLNPLGRAIGEHDGFPQYQLSHPERVLPDGSLVLFTDVTTGDAVHAMSGSLSSLVARGARVVLSALERSPFDATDVSGTLVTYCAGCMLTVGERMGEVADEIRQAIPGVPFLGSFTFGEQGCFLGGENRHANLMISAIVFGS